MRIQKYTDVKYESYTFKFKKNYFGQYYIDSYRTRKEVSVGEFHQLTIVLNWIKSPGKIKQEPNVYRLFNTLYNRYLTVTDFNRKQVAEQLDITQEELRTLLHKE
jgi:hypothetical protein